MAQVQLREDEAIDVLLVRAIEAEDADALVLTPDDREYASAAALSFQPLANPPSSRDRAIFLSRRSTLALDRVTARYPMLDRVRSLSRWPRWLTWSVLLGALAAGLATDVIGGKQLNILAFPLLALIAWNLAVYLVMALHAVLRRTRPKHSQAHPLRHALEWVVRPASARLAGQPTLERAIVRFAGDWSQAAGAITHARASRTLHLGAALFAIGVLAGMLLRARYASNYTAGWSGTWAGAEAEIWVMLKIILGPASVITGIPLPSLERLRELRGGRENAGNWLLLWAVTAGLFVILPRLILAAASGARATFLARHLNIADDFYLRSLIRNALGCAGNARIVPYGLQLSDAARERAVRLLTAALGQKTRVHVDPPIAYGAEDEWLAGEGEQLAAGDQLILLFSLASTPEAENHGALVQGVRKRIGTTGTQLLVLLDDTNFRRKLGTGASAQRRLQERLDTWKSVLAATGVSPLSISLNPIDEAPEAQRIEQALLRAGGPA